MNIALNKTTVLKLILVAWLVVWVIFLVREDKDDQYIGLKYLYTHGYSEGVRYIMGDKLNDFLLFAERNIPEGATYELLGFQRFSIDGYLVRYYLWPLKSVSTDPDFKLRMGATQEKIDGYREYKRYDNKAQIYVRKDLDL